MSLEDILKGVEARTHQEIENLNRYYESKKSEILEKHKHSVSSIQSSYSHQTEESARTLELSVLSSAQMEALKIVRTRQEELLEDFLDRAEEVISGYRKSQRYAALLSRLVKIAREALGNDCIISVAREDKDKLPAGVKATESDDDGVQKYGGIIASSSDGSLELNLSLKEIFSGIREKLISSILERLEE